jgi:hypothetical protein
MRFRAGLVVGFAVGFYFGAMAGRERYEQINRAVRQVKGSDVVDAATGTARSAVDQGFGRAKGFARDRFGRATGDGGGSGRGASPAPSTAHRGMTGPPGGPDAGGVPGGAKPTNGQPTN